MEIFDYIIKTTRVTVIRPEFQSLYIYNIGFSLELAFYVEQ